MSYAHGIAPHALRAETIADVFDRITAEHGSQVAIVSRHQQVRYTYAALRREVDHAAEALRALGVQRGDRVALWSTSRAEWLIAQYAIAKAGAVLVALNPAYTNAELVGTLRHSGARLLIAAEPPFREGAAPRVSEVARALKDGGGPSTHAIRPQPVQVVCFDAAPDDCLDWRDLLTWGGGMPASVSPPRSQYDDAACILYTSGTTGAPKGATMSHYSLVNSGVFVGDRLRYTAGDRICLPVPLFHTFGLVMGALAALTHGSTLVLPSHVFDPKAALEAIAEEQCTAVYGVPAQFRAMLAHRHFHRHRTASLRTGIMAGSPCPASLVREVMTSMHARELTICYGMTEAGTLCQTLPEDSPDDRTGTVGAVHPHVECKVVDPATERTVPRGEPGELWARGYCMMSGYWSDDAATRRAMTATGWIRTGDLAVMEAGGHVRIIDRLKDLIISGGQNIYPQEVEAVLRSHPQVRDVAVVGVPDALHDEIVCAWIEPLPGETPDPDEVKRFCRGRTAAYNIPRRIVVTEALPRTATGKIQKFSLREHAAIPRDAGAPIAVTAATPEPSTH